MDQNFQQRHVLEGNNTENNHLLNNDNEFMQNLYDNNAPKCFLIAFSSYNSLFEVKIINHNVPLTGSQNFGLLANDTNHINSNFNLGTYSINQQNTQNPFGVSMNISGGINQLGAVYFNQNNTNNGQQTLEDFNKGVGNTSFLEGDYMNANIQNIKKRQKSDMIKNLDSSKVQKNDKNRYSGSVILDSQNVQRETNQRENIKLKYEKSNEYRNQNEYTNLNSSNESESNNFGNQNINTSNNNFSINNSKQQIKNTYINKINSLISDKEQLKRESQFIQSLQKDQQFSDVILKDQRMQESVRIRQQQHQLQNQQNYGNINKSQPTIEASSKNITEVDAFTINSMIDKPSESSSSNIQTGRGFETIILQQKEKKLNEKLVRNRESARNSRKRKKIYIELLETKVANLNQELEKAKRALETNNQYINKMSFQTQLTGLNLSQTQLIDKLEKCIQSNGEENEINLLLDSLRFRLGTTGKERITVINYLFKQILDICIPAHFRYLLYTSDNDEDMFADVPFSGEQIEKRPDWRKELIQYVNLSDSQRQKLIKFKNKFKQEKKNLDNLIIQLSQVKNSIQEKTYALEHMVDSLRNYMNPIQSAKFLSYMERNRFRKEISNINLWQGLKFQNKEYDDQEDENVSPNNDTNQQLYNISQQFQPPQTLYFQQQQQYNQPQFGFNNSGFLGDFQQPITNSLQNQFYSGVNVQPNHFNLIGQNIQNQTNQQLTELNNNFSYRQNQTNVPEMQNNQGNNHQEMIKPSINKFSQQIEDNSLPRKKVKSNSASFEQN